MENGDAYGSVGIGLVGRGDVEGDEAEVFGLGWGSRVILLQV